MSVLDFNNLTIEQVKLLNEISLNFQEEFNALVAEIGEKSKSHIDWWVSTVASRNPYQSSLYMECCRLTLVNYLVMEEYGLKRIIVYSRGLYTAINSYVEEKDIPIEIVYRRSRPAGLIKVAKRFLFTVLQFLAMYFLSKPYKRKYDFGSNGITLLDVFVIDKSFVDNVYDDRYYGNIWNYVPESHRKDIYYFPTFSVRNMNYSRIYEKIRSCRHKFLLMEDFLTLGDYLYALCYPFRIFAVRIKDEKFMGFDVSQIIRDEVRRECTNNTSMIGILKYRSIARMNQKKVNLRLVIEWFENQNIDKAAVYGYSRYFKDTPVVGYEGFTECSDHNVFFYPTVQEKDSGVTPGCIAVTGRSLVERVKRFCPSLDAIVAPALRYKDFWKERVNYPDSHYYTVLIALPMTLDGSREIIGVVSQTLKTGRFEGFRFLVKHHPVNTPDLVKAYCSDIWDSRLEFIEGDFSACAEQSNLVVGSNSSTCMEALAKGIPVVIIGSQSGLTFNPIPGDLEEDIWRLCYTSEELDEALRYYSSLEGHKLKHFGKIGEEIGAGYFEPVTEDSVRRLLRL